MIHCVRDESAISHQSIFFLIALSVNDCRDLFVLKGNSFLLFSKVDPFYCYFMRSLLGHHDYAWMHKSSQLPPHYFGDRVCEWVPRLWLRIRGILVTSWRLVHGMLWRVSRASLSPHRLWPGQQNPRLWEEARSGIISPVMPLDMLASDSRRCVCLEAHVSVSISDPDGEPFLIPSAPAVWRDLFACAYPHYSHQFSTAHILHKEWGYFQFQLSSPAKPIDIVYQAEGRVALASNFLQCVNDAIEWAEDGRLIV